MPYIASLNDGILFELIPRIKNMYQYLPFQFSETDEYELRLIRESANKVFDPLAEFTTMRTYSRTKFNTNGDILGRETRDEIYRRVVCGTMSLIEERLRDIDTYHKHGKNIKAWAYQMYSALWNRKVSPPGRGLWSMGTKFVNHDKMGFPLINCTFITSDNIDIIKWEFFRYIADTLMLGVGVGYDTEGAGKIDISMPIQSNYVRFDDFYLLIDQLKSFRDTSFALPNGELYIDYEINYINGLEIAHKNRYRVHKIADSREGWCDAMCELLKSYMVPGEHFVVFDYSRIRKAGEYLKTFGGKSSGPKPLAEMFAAIRYILQEKYLGKPIDELFIIDICNIIARTVVAGNVRRSSQICISENVNIIECKRYSDVRFGYRKLWGWGSNNSVLIKDKLSEKDLNSIMNTAKYCGEPGLFFLKNARMYGRIIDGVNNIDIQSDGTNPCGEITLRGTDRRIASPIPYSAGGETCNLVETMPSNYNFDFANFSVNWELLFSGIHDKSIRDCPTTGREYEAEKLKLRDYLKDYIEDIFIAHLYVKTVTLVPLHWKSSQQIQEVNRRVGVSMTGIAVLLSQMGLSPNNHAEHGNMEYIKDGMQNEQSIVFKRFAVFLDLMYQVVDDNDKRVSAMLKIPQSIKCRTVKPSGTTSICNGVPSGMHFPYSQYYIRRVRVNTSETELIETYRNMGYTVKHVVDNPNTVSVWFPVKMSDTVVARDKANIDLQFKILYYLQYYWSDNQVSCTINFWPHEVDRLSELIYRNRDTLKGLSYFPHFDEEKYNQSRVEQLVGSGKSETEAKHEIYDSLPNEPISRERYDKMVAELNQVSIVLKASKEEYESDMYCDGDSCMRRQ